MAAASQPTHRDSGSEVKTYGAKHAATSPSTSRSAKDAGYASNPARRSVSNWLPELSRLWRASRALHGQGCTGCGICFYCCPEPGRHHRLSAGAAQEWCRKSAREAIMRQLCKGNVAVIKGACWRVAAPITDIPSRPPARSPKLQPCIFLKSVERSCRRRARPLRSTWSMARRPRASG